MNEKETILQVTVDAELQRRAEKVLADQGIALSVAVGLLLRRIVEDQQLPFELKVPNPETRAAMAEASGIMAARRLRFASPEAMFAHLEKDHQE